MTGFLPVHRASRLATFGLTLAIASAAQAPVARAQQLAVTPDEPLVAPTKPSPPLNLDVGMLLGGGGGRVRWSGPTMPSRVSSPYSFGGGVFALEATWKPVRWLATGVLLGSMIGSGTSNTGYIGGDFAILARFVVPVHTAPQVSHGLALQVEGGGESASISRPNNINGGVSLGLAPRLGAGAGYVMSTSWGGNFHLRLRYHRATHHSVDGTHEDAVVSGLDGLFGFAYSL